MFIYICNIRSVSCCENEYLRSIKKGLLWPQWAKLPSRSGRASPSSCELISDFNLESNLDKADRQTC